MKKGILIGLLAIVAIVIAGCTQQVRESQSKSYGGVTYQGVLGMLNNCNRVSGNSFSNCNEACSSDSSTCAVGLLVTRYDLSSPEQVTDVVFLGCDEVIDAVPDSYSKSCYCCQPPA